MLLFLFQHSYVLWFPAVAGWLIVIGSIFLLYKGVISLNRVSAGEIDEALVAKISDIFSIRSGNPAVSLFVIGLLLVLSPLFLIGFFYWIEKPGMPIDIRGKVAGTVPPEFGVLVEVPLKIKIPIHPDEHGNFTATTFVQMPCMEITPFLENHYPDPNKYSWQEWFKEPIQIRKITFLSEPRPFDRASGMIFGEVVSADGKPAPGLEVYVQYSDTRIGRKGPVVTLADGKYGITGLPVTKDWLDVEVCSGGKCLSRKRLDALTGLVAEFNLILPQSR